VLAEGTITNRQSTLVRPGIPIPPEASAVHHLIDEDLADAPPLMDAICSGARTPTSLTTPTSSSPSSGRCWARRRRSAQGRMLGLDHASVCGDELKMTRDWPRKLLIYLDQNFVSEMAKTRDSPQRLEFEKLHDVLHEGFWGEKFVLLRSIFHDVETSLAGSLKGPIRTRQSMMGHVDLERPWEIKEMQVAAALQRYLGRMGAPDVISFEDAFEKDPDRRVGHFDIRVDTDWMHAGEKEERARVAVALDSVRKRILRDAVSYDAQIAIEMEGMRKAVLREPWRYTTADVTVSQLAEFVASEAFAEVPIVNLEVCLLTRLMTAHATRPIKQGDVTDVDAIAAYLPYCDVYGADRFTAGVARSLGVPQRYGCKLFDSQSKGVSDLVEHLRKAADEMVPVNVPALSIFVVSDDGIKQRSFSFFQRVGNQAKRAEGHLGAWIEVFGFDDGAMPSYPMGSGLACPFYGLQEVQALKCEQGASKEYLVNACRKACRSSHFVLVDAYQDLPDNFIAIALGAQMNGANSVLAYRIYSRASK
jgi:hypothetical protein